MRLENFRALFQVLIQGRSAMNLLLATFLSFSFSICVILCTVGLMDGFELVLKSGLRYSAGDLYLHHRQSFFEMNPKLEESLKRLGINRYTGLIQHEGFLLSDGKSRGVLLKGIEPESFSQTTGLSFNLYRGEVIIGDVLARQFNLKLGSEVVIAFGKGNESIDYLPGLRQFKVAGIVKHGIYEKDLRFLYALKEDVSEVVESGSRINQLLISLYPPTEKDISLDHIREVQTELQESLPKNYTVRPFWYEFSSLLQAVKVEKFSIGMILQLIVIVAVFNIAAFVIYLSEKKAQEIFLIRALGVSMNQIWKFWLIMITIVWSLSCGGAYLLSLVFNWGLAHLSILQVPGEVYVLSQLSLAIKPLEYIIVYGLSLAWVLLALLVGYWRLRRRSILEGLRLEFQ
jgi:ABC-type lipoprotein release transport system permease subunit